MVINLNKKKEYLSKKDVLTYVNDWDIYKFYINDADLNINKVISSPLRSDEKPSFGLFIGESGEICFKDFNISAGDCIKFVQLKFGLDYYEALSKVAIDFNFDSDFIVKRNPNTDYNQITSFTSTKLREDVIKDLNTYTLGKKSRKWSLKDISFWYQFGITIKTLERYNVEPISHIFINDKILKCDDYTYCFIENKDGIQTYKIYQPFNKKYKWLNNHNSSVWQGWTQLPKEGDILIITKSLKDAMSLRDICGIPSISLQSESAKPKEQIIDELKSRFKDIYIFYDNDYDKEENWGRNFGIAMSNAFDSKQIEINESYQSKDFTDLVKNHGKEIAREWLFSNIDAPF